MNYETSLRDLNQKIMQFIFSNAHMNPSWFADKSIESINYTVKKTCSTSVPASYSGSNSDSEPF